MNSVTHTERWDTLLALIGAQRVVNYNIPKNIRGIVEKLGPKGKGVTPEELLKAKESFKSTHPLIDHEGKPFVLYIYDQAVSNHFRGPMVYNTHKEYKYHVMWCSTLRDMNRIGRSARYKAKYDLENTLFTVNKGEKHEQRTEMRVCRNCLRGLNYNGYASEYQYTKDQIFDTFNVREFFIDYAQPLLISPSHPFSTGRYTHDWPDISRLIRKERGNRCEECGESGPLDVHHINGVKDDNRDSNLQVLCRTCHMKKPMHDHLRHLKLNQATYEYGK